MMCGVKLCPTLPNPAKGANFEAGAEAGRVGENWPTSATGLTVAVRTFLGWAASWARRAAAASSGVAYFRGRPLFFAAELERAPLTGGGGGDDELVQEEQKEEGPRQRRTWPNRKAPKAPRRQG